MFHASDSTKLKNIGWRGPGKIVRLEGTNVVVSFMNHEHPRIGDSIKKYYEPNEVAGVFIVVLPSHTMSIEKELIEDASVRLGQSDHTDPKQGMRSDRTDPCCSKLLENETASEKYSALKVQHYAMSVLMEGQGRKVLSIDVCDKIGVHKDEGQRNGSPPSRWSKITQDGGNQAKYRIFMIVKDKARIAGTCASGMGAVLKSEQKGDSTTRILLGDFDEAFFGTGSFDSPVEVRERLNIDHMVSQDPTDCITTDAVTVDSEMEPHPLDGSSEHSDPEDRQLNKATSASGGSDDAANAYNELFGEDPGISDEILEQQYQDISSEGKREVRAATR